MKSFAVTVAVVMLAGRAFAGHCVIECEDGNVHATNCSPAQIEAYRGLCDAPRSVENTTTTTTTVSVESTTTTTLDNVCQPSPLHIDCQHYSKTHRRGYNCIVASVNGTRSPCKKYHTLSDGHVQATGCAVVVQ
jgi:hypothetical protein